MRSADRRRARSFATRRRRVVLAFGLVALVLVLAGLASCKVATDIVVRICVVTADTLRAPVTGQRCAAVDTVRTKG